VYRITQNILLSGLSPAVCCSLSFDARADASREGDGPSIFDGLSTSGDFPGPFTADEKVARLGDSGSRLSDSKGPRKTADSFGVGRDGVVGVREVVSDCART
jgi:hypothetical protein